MDQVAIYIMIAGTYTPIVWFYLSDPWRTGILVAQWGFAALGIILKIIHKRMVMILNLNCKLMLTKHDPCHVFIFSN